MADHEAPTAAPGELETVRRLLNTLDVEDGVDRLDAPWLRDAGLAGEELDAAGLERVRALRDALRDLLSGGGAGAVERLNELAAGAPLAVAFDGGGRAHLHPSAAAGDAAVAGRVLAIVERAQADGTWERLKACAAETCRWAFYDRSRNRSRHWCDMAVCGNRAKARSYRDRTA